MAGRHYPLSLIITGVDRITGPLNRINAKIKGLTAPLRPVANSIKSMSEAAGLPRLVDGFKKVGSAINDVSDAAQRSALRVAGVVAVAGGLAMAFHNQFIRTADTFDRLELSLEAITGSAAEARRSMAFIKDLTVKTPFEMEDVAKAFRILKGFELDPIKNDTLKAIADQVAKLGLRGEDLSGIAMQLGQAFSSGRLQARDANILVERGVPVWGLLQRAIMRVNAGQKINIGQLRKMSEEGQLGQRAVLELIRQMGKESEGASARMMGTWTGLMSNLSDRWTFFKKRVMDGGPMTTLKMRLGGILDTLERMERTGDLDKLADRVGGRLMQAFDWLWNIGIPDGMKALKELGGWVSWLADICGGWGNLLKFGLAAYIGGPLVAALFSLTAAVVSLGLAIGLTPVGWILGGLVLIGLAAITLTKKWGAVKTFFVDLWAGVTQVFFGFLGFLRNVFHFRIGRALDSLADAFKGLGSIIGVAFRPLQWLAETAARAGGAIGSFVSPFGSSAPGESAGPIADPRSWLQPRPSHGPSLEDSTSWLRPRPSHGPSLVGADAATARGRGQARGTDARVEVEFTNVPRGVRITRDPRSTTPLDLSVGRTMAEAY